MATFDFMQSPYWKDPSNRDYFSFLSDPEWDLYQKYIGAASGASGAGARHYLGSGGTMVADQIYKMYQDQQNTWGGALLQPSWLEAANLVPQYNQFTEQQSQYLEPYKGGLLLQALTGVAKDDFPKMYEEWMPSIQEDLLGNYDAWNNILSGMSVGMTPESWQKSVTNLGTGIQRPGASTSEGQFLERLLSGLNANVLGKLPTSEQSWGAMSQPLTDIGWNEPTRAKKSLGWSLLSGALGLIPGVGIPLAGLVGGMTALSNDQNGWMGALQGALQGYSGSKLGNLFSGTGTLAGGPLETYGSGGSVYGTAMQNAANQGLTQLGTQTGLQTAGAGAGGLLSDISKYYSGTQGGDMAIGDWVNDYLNTGTSGSSGLSGLLDNWGGNLTNLINTTNTSSSSGTGGLFNSLSDLLNPVNKFMGWEWGNIGDVFSNIGDISKLSNLFSGGGGGGGTTSTSSGSNNILSWLQQILGTGVGNTTLGDLAQYIPGLTTLFKDSPERPQAYSMQMPDYATTAMNKLVETMMAGPQQFQMDIPGMMNTFGQQQTQDWNQWLNKVNPTLAESGQLDSSYAANLRAGMAEKQALEGQKYLQNLQGTQSAMDYELQKYFPQLYSNVYGQGLQQAAQNMVPAQTQYQAELARYFGDLGQQDQASQLLGQVLGQIFGSGNQTGTQTSGDTSNILQQLLSLFGGGNASQQTSTYTSPYQSGGSLSDVLNKYLNYNPYQNIGLSGLLG